MNHIIDTDGYKLSHAKMYPPNTTQVFSYIESRGVGTNIFGNDFIENPEITHFGSNQVADLLAKPITQENIDEADELLSGYGVEWNKPDWELILNDYGGYLPLKVYGLLDGTTLTPHTPQMVVTNTDPRFPWLTSYMETPLLRLWYPSTVATLSRSIKKIINDYLLATADSNDGLVFKLHDFGSRGVSSRESAMIGGLAHLVNFRGTDTLQAFVGAKRFFGATGIGNSIPASEHSTITAWGRENEVEAYRNFLNYFAKPGAIIACVSDSYDVFNACDKIWGGELRQQVIDSGAVLVVRPDSGDPVYVVRHIIQILDDRFGSTVNSKGYKLLNHVRVIQGDGINATSIIAILAELKRYGYSADNLAFGMGGALLQQVNRDSLKYAMKASAIKIDGTWREVYKDPITDPGKRSKKGLLTTRFTDNGTMYWKDQLSHEDKVFFGSAFANIYTCEKSDNGNRWPKLSMGTTSDTFDRVRERAAI